MDAAAAATKKATSCFKHIFIPAVYRIYTMNTVQQWRQLKAWSSMFNRTPPRSPETTKRLSLPDDMWSEELSKQKSLILFGQWRSWGKLALLVWPLGLPISRRSWILVEPQWLGAQGQSQLESDLPSSPTGLHLAPKVDASIWRKGVDETLWRCSLG